MTAPRPGRMEVHAVDGLGGWSEELEVSALTTSEAAGKKKVQRGAERYDDDGHSKCIGLRPLLLVAVTYGGESAPPTNEETSNAKET